MWVEVEYSFFQIELLLSLAVLILQIYIQFTFVAKYSIKDLISFRGTDTEILYLAFLPL